MSDANLSSVQNIEVLQQKVQTYKETLSALKTGSSIDEYLFIKQELDRFQEKFTDLEKLIDQINKKQNTQVIAYEQEITNLTAQLDTLNQTVEELNLSITEPANNTNNTGFSKSTVEEITHPVTNSVNRGIPSFNQLKKMSQQSQMPENLSRPENSPPPNQIRYHQEYAPEKTYGLNKNFPSRQSTNQIQTIGSKSRVNMNEPSSAKRISVKLSSIDAYPMPHTTIENDNARAAPYIEEATQDTSFANPEFQQNKVEEHESFIQASNDNAEESRQTIDQVNRATEDILKNKNVPQTNDSFTEAKQVNEEVTKVKEPSSNKVAVMDENDVVTQKPENPEQQTTKSKETLSLLNIFRKK